MNLNSGFQEDAHWFWTVFALLVMGSVSAVFYMFNYVKSSGWLIT